MTDRLEKLRLIFALGQRPGAEMQVGGHMLRQLKPEGGIGDANALQRVVETMSRLGMPMTFVRNDGSTQSAIDFLRLVKTRGKWSVSVKCEGLSFSFGNVTARRHSFLTIEEVTAGAGRPWDEWVKPFLEEPTFVQAWIVDLAYDRWQNTEDPAQFDAAGLSYAGRPMKSNGLPHPLEKKIIDIADNPGRWTLRDGYVEAVGATMWFGAAFWNLVGNEKRRRLELARGVDTKEIGHDALRVNAAPCSFCDESDRDMQDRLRSLLFN